MSWIKVDTQGDGIGGTIESETWLNTDLIESISQYNLKVPRVKIKTQSGEEYYVTDSAKGFMREHGIGPYAEQDAEGVDLTGKVGVPPAMMIDPEMFG